MTWQPSNRLVQRGIVLVSSLLLLIVVTIMALSMFRSFGTQEKIAGNLREKQRALQAAESAQQYAEWWLNNNASSAAVVCTELLNANTGQGQICSNKLATVVADINAVPWQSGAAEIGVIYTPPNMKVTASSALNTYYAAPRFYISDLGVSLDPSIPGEIYQIDAVGFGGTASATAIVESTFAVYVTSKNLTL